MITFLPYPSFQQSAEVLDNSRLLTQRGTCYQILESLAGLSKGWRQKPGFKMWQGYEHALVLYSLAICDECVKRGFRDRYRKKFIDMLKRFPEGPQEPPWLKDPRLSSSHRAQLLQKDPGHYQQFGWREDPETPYFWPVKGGV